MRHFPRTAWILTAIGAFTAPAVSHATTAVRWGPLGHRIVAAVALDRLSPGVAAETRRLLGGQDITEIASWPDEHRSEMPALSAWHYVDIEITDSSYVPERDCKDNNCIVAAISAQTAILADRTRPDSDRAVALKWVVHLVGDIHQPLHGGERGDRGGNDVKITFQGRRTNLHALWDSGMLLSFGQTEADIVRTINDQIATRTDIATLINTTPAQWATGSHNVARDVVYANLPASLDITQDYVDAARPVIYERLLRAGVRLAAVLERALRS
ncbi:MAG: S1/P1 nuclease [Gemmatimonadales bacterium]